jgi:hypothetical protein
LNEAVSGQGCSGSYCDNVRLLCTTLPFGATIDSTSAINFGTNRYATGVECNGSHCDQKRFYVCSMVDPTPVFEIGARR